jgi:hypothetical protein
VVQQGVHQIPGNLQVRGSGGCGFAGQQDGVVNQFSGHNSSPFPGNMKAAHKPPNMNIVSNPKGKVNGFSWEIVFP